MRKTIVLSGTICLCLSTFAPRAQVPATVERSAILKHPSILCTIKAVESPNPQSGKSDLEVAVTIKNLTNEVLLVPEFRITVTRDGTEAATTLLQRQISHRLKTGEPEIEGGGYRPEVEPGSSFTQTIQLSKLYDMRQSGTYVVQARVMHETLQENGKLKSAKFMHWIALDPVSVTVP